MCGEVHTSHLLPLISILVHLSFWDRVSQWPGAYCCSYSGWPGSPQVPPFFTCFHQLRLRMRTTVAHALIASTEGAVCPAPASTEKCWIEQGWEAQSDEPEPEVAHGWIQDSDQVKRNDYSKVAASNRQLTSSRDNSGFTRGGTQKNGTELNGRYPALRNRGSLKTYSTYLLFTALVSPNRCLQFFNLLQSQYNHVLVMCQVITCC